MNNIKRKGGLIIMVSIYSNSSNNSYGVKNFILDTDADHRFR